MKKFKNILTSALCIVLLSLFFVSCKKFKIDEITTTPVDIGGTPETYPSVDENSVLQIPINFTTPCDSGLASASYKVVNNRAGSLKLVFSPPVDIPFDNKTVNTTINVPVRMGLKTVVITIYDKAGKLSSKSIDIQNVVPSTAALKVLKDVVMSTDPDDQENFFSFYETNPVYGSTGAMTKQDKVDMLLVNMGGAKFISPHAYGASDAYYNASKDAMAGFSTLSYSFISSSKTYISPANFDAINTEADLTAFFNDSVIAPKTGNYNVISADRRVGDTYNTNSVNKGFIIGWGYHTLPTATTAIVLNEAFGLIMVKSVMQKPNGHFVITFDMKAPATDERSSYSATPIAPYDPYPL